MSQPPSGPGRKRTTRARKGRGSAATNPSRPEPRVLTTMRLRQSLRKDLEATAARNRRSVADVAQELLDEALRMRHCPGIYFADEPSGRTAKIGGTGLGVWEVVRDFSRDQDAVATNAEHAGIVLVPSSFRGDEFPLIADAIFEALKPYRHGLRGLVLYIKRG